VPHFGAFGTVLVGQEPGRPPIQLGRSSRDVSENISHASHPFQVTSTPIALPVAIAHGAVHDPRGRLRGLGLNTGLEG
jgi:hypothetical protein